MKILYIFLFPLLFLIACKQEKDLADIQSINDYYWRIDTMDMSGTSVRPVFPIVTQTEYVVPSASLRDLYDESRVLITMQGKSVFVYPLNYLHIEVVNELADDKYFAVTYCPITKSAMIWNRRIEDEILTLAASGILYKENLVIYDIRHKQFWSQMLISKIYGNTEQKKPEVLSSFETSWQTVKKYFPNAMVFNGKYNNISESLKHPSEKIVFPDTSDNNNYNMNYAEGEKIYGIILPDEVKTYSHNTIENETKIIRNNDMVLVSSAQPEFVVSFYTDNLELSLVKNNFPVILTDQNNNKYDVFGKPVNISGISPLKPTCSYSASWWAWKAFYKSFSKI
jgi:hypothetical protein